MPKLLQPKIVIKMQIHPELRAYLNTEASRLPGLELDEEIELSTVKSAQFSPIREETKV